MPDITVIADTISFRFDASSGLLAVTGEGEIGNNAVQFRMVSHLLLTPDAARHLLTHIDDLKMLLQRAASSSGDRGH